jgi:hypothetical protein
MQGVRNGLSRMNRYGRRFGPYLMLELLLPGGTLFAFLYFLHQRGKVNGGEVVAGRAD